MYLLLNFPNNSSNLNTHAHTHTHKQVGTQMCINQCKPIGFSPLEHKITDGNIMESILHRGNGHILLLSTFHAQVGFYYMVGL